MLKAIISIGVIQALAIAVNLGKVKFLAILLGPSGIGVVSVIDQIAQLVAYVSAFSIPFSAVKFLSRSHSVAIEDFQKSYASFFRLLLTLSIAGAAAALALLLWRSDLLGPQFTTYRAILAPAMITVPAIALNGYCSGVLAAAQRGRAAALLALVTNACFTVTAFLGVVLGGVTGLYWGNLAAAVLVLLGTTVYFRRRLHLSVFERGGRTWRQLRAQPQIVVYSLILSGASCLMSLSYFVARLTVLRHYGEAEAGLLQAAIALSGAIGLVLGPANGLYLTPILNREVPLEQKLRAAVEFQRRLLAILVLIASPMCLFPQLIVPILYTPSFAAVGDVLFLFVVAQCLLQLAGVYQALLIGLDDLAVYGLLTGGGFVCLGGMSWSLAPHIGLVGVALGFLTGSVVTFVLSLGRLIRRYRLSLPARLSGSIAFSLTLLLLMGYWFDRAGAGSLAAVVVRCGAYAMVVAGLLGLLDAEERRRLRGTVARFPTAMTGRFRQGGVHLAIAAADTRDAGSERVPGG